MSRQVAEQHGAKEFLEAIARNSKNTASLYSAGLTHFQNFLGESQTLQGIVRQLLNREKNVYEVLNSFVGYLLQQKNCQDETMSISRGSIVGYVAGVRSYLGYYDIEIDPRKYKQKVKIPKQFEEEEEALDAADIRKILLACNNRRLKAFMLVVASDAARVIETCALRNCDLDFTITPTKIHVRKEYAKTKVARDIYISDEATQYLKQWLEWKYRENRYSRPTRKETDLVFASSKNATLDALYNRLRDEFNKLLEVVDLGGRKDGMQRRKITLHSLRRHADVTISDAAGKDYAEWFLGHAKNSYYTKKESARREMYATKCMSQLTFLDYTAFESTGKNVEDLQSQNAQLKKEIEELKSKDKDLDSLREDILKLKAQFEEEKQTDKA